MFGVENCEENLSPCSTRHNRQLFIAFDCLCGLCVVSVWILPHPYMQYSSSSSSSPSSIHITLKTRNSTNVSKKWWCCSECVYVVLGIYLCLRGALLSKIEQHLRIECGRRWSVFMLHNFQEVTHSVDLTCQLCMWKLHMHATGASSAVSLVVRILFAVMQHSENNVKTFNKNNMKRLTHNLVYLLC